MLDLEKAIDDIVKFDVLEIYVKLSQEVDIDNRPSTLVKELDTA